MDILIPDSWLRDYLETKATPKQIANYLSLCGPTVDKIVNKGKEAVYSIEVTTNRVDSASVYGIAREAVAILPRFGITTKLKSIPQAKLSKTRKLDLAIKNNPKLCKRILTIKMSNVTISDSPKWMAERLEKAGQRPLNNLIDITNYVMWEVGHPIHVFDYDKLTNKTIIVREASAGEGLISLDGKVHKMFGGEVVFDNGEGEIIDLPGIMGTKNSVVGPDTKNILVWIESIDPVKIRQASMAHGIRTQAAILNEKAVDPELGLVAILRGVALYKEIAKAKQASSLFDLNEEPYKTKEIKVAKEFIDEKIGVVLYKNDIKNSLIPLGFEANWQGNLLTLKVPSFRAADIDIPEDVVEEIARIYGYHNLPSEIMSGKIPGEASSPIFDFEQKVKNLLSGMGGVEVYNYSLVPEDWTNKGALKLTNPLGVETEYLRTSLKPSLVSAAKSNPGVTDSFHLFEIANIYLPKKADLPDEVLSLGGVFLGYSYRKAKGIIETFLDELGVSFEFISEDFVGFLPAKRVVVKSRGEVIGELGILDEGNLIYYDFTIETLMQSSRPSKTFKPIPKYPPQIEDLTLVLPQKTKVGEVMEQMKMVDKYVESIKLRDIYNNSYTLRVWYQHPTKTLDNKEVGIIRNKIIDRVKIKFGARVKE